jgi:hypothetical protein
MLPFGSLQPQTMRAFEQLGKASGWCHIPEVSVRAFMKGLRQMSTLRCLNCCFQFWLFLRCLNFPSILYRECNSQIRSLSFVLLTDLHIYLLNTRTHYAFSGKNAEMNKGLAFVWSHLYRGAVSRNQVVSGSSLSPETGTPQLFFIVFLSLSKQMTTTASLRVFFSLCFC